MLQWFPLGAPPTNVVVACDAQFLQNVTTYTTMNETNAEEELLAALDGEVVRGKSRVPVSRDILLRTIDATNKKVAALDSHQEDGVHGNHVEEVDEHGGIAGEVQAHEGVEPPGTGLADQAATSPPEDAADKQAHRAEHDWESSTLQKSAHGVQGNTNEAKNSRKRKSRTAGAFLGTRSKARLT